MADEVVFTRVLDLMDARTAAHDRVFMATLTVSHHRPFDVPGGRTAFGSDRTSAHAMAYADYALGEFIDAARQRAWFNETLFVVVADHGARIEGSGLIPIEGYRVPLLFFAPGRLSPGTVDTLGSTMSLPATLARLLALDHTQSFFGADLLSGVDGPVPVEYNYHFGLLERSGLTVVARDGATFRSDGRAVTKDERERVLSTFGRAHAWFYGAMREHSAQETALVLP